MMPIYTRALSTACLLYTSLIARRVINPIVPFAYIGTVAAISGIACAVTGRDVLVDILSGGLMLGAFFMATDYATTPINWRGKLVFAIGCGIITMLIRLFGSLPEGVSYSIVLMLSLIHICCNSASPPETVTPPWSPK